ncbi:MAG: iron-sulfur cluster assembly accessory protein [bacterium]|nr:iron-sulfur cluster assembly accessory protein [bacterium]
MEQTIEPIKPTTATSCPPLSLTLKAVEKIKYFASQTQNVEGKFFRVSVQGGGCSGYQYSFAFDQKNAEDLEIHIGGLTVILDPRSLPYLKGSEVDFAETLNGAGFNVKNPNATGGCSCGQSFQT